MLAVQVLHSLISVSNVIELYVFVCVCVCVCVLVYVFVLNNINARIFLWFLSILIVCWVSFLITFFLIIVHRPIPVLYF